MNTNDWLTNHEVADALGISGDGVRYLARTGKLGKFVTTRIGRLFNRDVVEQLARERGVKRQNATTLTQAELDELYRSATSSSTASDALQARLRQAIGKPTG